MDMTAGPAPVRALLGRLRLSECLRPKAGMRRLRASGSSRGSRPADALHRRNLFCGYLSIWCSIRGTFENAAYLVIVAAVLDALDGASPA